MFKLKENNTPVKTEIIAGLTTFMAMAYIIALNPDMLNGSDTSGSIGHAIGLGLISFTVIKLFSSKAKEVSVLTYIISLLFLVKFFLVV